MCTSVVCTSPVSTSTGYRFHFSDYTSGFHLRDYISDCNFDLRVTSFFRPHFKIVVKNRALLIASRFKLANFTVERPNPFRVVLIRLLDGSKHQQNLVVVFFCLKNTNFRKRYTQIEICLLFFSPQSPKNRTDYFSVSARYRGIFHSNFSLKLAQKSKSKI